MKTNNVSSFSTAGPATGQEPQRGFLAELFHSLKVSIVATVVTAIIWVILACVTGWWLRG